MSLNHFEESAKLYQSKLALAWALPLQLALTWFSYFFHTVDGDNPAPPIRRTDLRASFSKFFRRAGRDLSKKVNPGRRDLSVVRVSASPDLRRPKKRRKTKTKIFRTIAKHFGSKPEFFVIFGRFGRLLPFGGGTRQQASFEARWTRDPAALWARTFLLYRYKFIYHQQLTFRLSGTKQQNQNQRLEPFFCHRV